MLTMRTKTKNPDGDSFGNGFVAGGIVVGLAWLVVRVFGGKSAPAMAQNVATPLQSVPVECLRPTVAQVPASSRPWNYDPHADDVYDPEDPNGASRLVMA